MAITPEDEKRYGLKPLPEVEPLTQEEAAELNEAYVEHRRVYREANPLRSTKE